MTGITAVRFVSGVDSFVVDEVPLGPKRFATLTFERSLSSVFPHVHLQIKLFDKPLTTLLTQMTFDSFDLGCRVLVLPVGLWLSFSDEASATVTAPERFVTRMDPSMTFQLIRGDEGLVAHLARVRSHI